MPPVGGINYCGGRFKWSFSLSAILWEIIDEMASNVSNYFVHLEKDFLHKKKWDFATLVKYIILIEG